MSRTWAMPNSLTFKIKPINEFVKSYLAKSKVSIDPFARNSNLATFTNDINPNTNAQYHLEAGEFLDELFKKNIKADLVILDWPYSPRQVKECYDNIGRAMTQQDGWTAHSRKVWKERITKVITDDATVLTFGWNTTGMGRKLGFDILEILMVCHGADHNDTICLAEQKISNKI